MIVTERATWVGILYAALLAAALAFTAWSYSEFQMEAGILLVIGFAFTALCLGIVIDFLRTPKQPIIQTEDNQLLMGNGQKIAPEDIYDVSYRKASSRGYQYSWGTVIVKTYTAGEFTYRYMSDCEGTAKYLMKLMYTSKK